MQRIRRVFAACLIPALVHSPVADASCATVDLARCITRRAPDGTLVQYPRLDWTPIASAARQPGGTFQLNYLRGGATQVTRNVTAAALGIPGGQVSGVFLQPPGAPPIVFARFAPGSNELRIDVLRIQRGIDGVIRVADAVYGPHRGERFIATQGFLSATDLRAGRPGLNPMAAWKSPEDNVFHQICFTCPDSRGNVSATTSGVATALGLAMRDVGAQLGILAVAREWVDVQEHSSGGLLWSTVTVDVSGYAQPDWWIASPIGAQIAGTSTLGVCAIGNESPCRPEHVVMAGIQLAPWSGPNLPTDQDLLYHSQNSQSGLTVLGYSLITAALVGFGSYLWGGEALSSGGVGEASMTTPSVGGSAGTIGSAGLNALAGGASYLAGSDSLHPSSPDQLQNGFLGSTLSSGTWAASQPNGSAAISLQSAATNAQISAPLAAALTGVKSLYQGNCAAKEPRARCPSGNVGQTPRIGDAPTSSNSR